jgi:hypothetical protein
MRLRTLPYREVIVVYLNPRSGHVLVQVLEPVDLQEGIYILVHHTGHLPNCTVYDVA